LKGPLLKTSDYFPMSKVAKIILGVCAVLLLIVIAAGIYLSRNLPHLVKEAVETTAPKTTGTPVTLGGVHFNFMTGTVTLSNFVVGNPPGFSTDHAFRFDKLKFQIDLATVFKKVIVIREFRIDDSNIIAEQKGSITNTNLRAIADHASHAMPPPESEPKNTKAAAKPKASPKLILKKLVFSNNTVDVVSEVIGPHKIKLPDIVLKDIGRAEGGLTPDQMTQRITQLVTQQVSDAVKEELKKVAREKGKEAVVDKIKSWFGK